MVAANANDVIRHQILEWFYERNATSTSHRGKRGSAVKISDIKRGLKESYGLSAQQVNSNLTYLVEKGWINREEVDKRITTAKGTYPSTQVWYEISPEGIDKIEGESEFKDTGRFGGVNVNAFGSNVIQLGDGNIVNAKYAEAEKRLSDLKDAALAAELSDEQKVAAIVDIDGIRDQLAKAQPDSEIVKIMWSRIEEVATLGGFVSAIDLVFPYLRTLIAGE